MPLSEHEQRLLNEIEQALYAEDPKFVSAVRSARSRSRLRRSVAVCVLGVIAGLGLVLVGLLTKVVVLSVLGFVLIVGACGYLVQGLHSRAPAGSPEQPRQQNKAPRQAGLRSRMEDRLRRRFDEG